MEIDPIIAKFLSEICEAFPEIRSRMDAHDDYMTTWKMEEFANATTEAFDNGKLARAVEYLTFMSKRLFNNNPREYEFIDVYYVENLFWPRKTEAARVGWPLMPNNLKELYLGFHGKAPI